MASNPVEKSFQMNVMKICVEKDISFLKIQKNIEKKTGFKFSVDALSQSVGRNTPSARTYKQFAVGLGVSEKRLREGDE